MPFAPVLVLTGCVVPFEFAARHRPERKWARIKCASREAHGCGKHGREVVEGITLYRSVDDYPHLTTSLCLAVSEDAFRGIQTQLCARYKHLAEAGTPLRPIHVHGNVEVAEQRLVVLSVRFSLRCNDLVYYLVYDSRAASLSMIPALPDNICEVSYTMTPVLESSGGDYELALLACKLWGPKAIDQDVLCVCTPDARANAAPAPDGVGPWEMVRRRFRKRIHDPFFADVMFSLDGKAFWADLLQGMVYCDLRGRSSSDMELGFIRLPKQYRVDFVDEEKDTGTEPTKKSRTVGCFEGSICFVCIDRDGAYGDEVLTVWTMEQPGDKWKIEVKKTAKELWELHGFKEAGLPMVAPQYPVLMPDGALCLVLSGAPDVMEDADDSCRLDIDSKSLLEEDSVEDHIFSFDMRNMRLQWHGRVRDYHTTEPVIVHSNFFKTQQVPHKRKLDEHRHARLTPA